MSKQGWVTVGLVALVLVVGGAFLVGTWVSGPSGGQMMSPTGGSLGTGMMGSGGMMQGPSMMQGPGMMGIAGMGTMHAAMQDMHEGMRSMGAMQGG